MKVTLRRLSFNTRELYKAEHLDVASCLSLHKNCLKVTARVYSIDKLATTISEHGKYDFWLQSTTHCLDQGAKIRIAYEEEGLIWILSGKNFESGVGY